MNRHSNGGKILVIDDDPEVLAELAAQLKAAGYAVITAPDGEIGMVLFERESPELVVTNIRMPGIDGLEVLKRIKEADPDREVIVTTATTERDYAIRALQLDASDFVTKPISHQALMVALKRAQERYNTRKELRDYTAFIEERWMATSEKLASTYHSQKLLIESSIDGIIACDREGKIIIFNRSMSQMLGYLKSEALEMNINDIFCQGEAERFSKTLESREFGGEGKLFLYESWLADRDGARIPVQLSAVTMLQDDVDLGIVCFCRDERQIRKLAQEVADQARLLHQDKMISLGKLAASVVHEINNPLAGILNYARLMSRILSRGSITQDTSAKFQKYLSLMESELEHCSKIVSNLLAFSRKSTIEFTPVDVNEVLSRCISLSGHKMDLQNIRVNMNLARDLPAIPGDFNQLQQCMINLILNAIDAMPDGGTLTLASAFDPSTRVVRIQVRDTGSGISRDSLPYIFDPFFTTKEEGKGLGLGLSTTFGIINRHRGTIHVESEAGKETVFEISLPANT